MKVKLIIAIILLYTSFPAQELVWKHTGGPLGGLIGDMEIDSKGNIYACMYEDWYGYHYGIMKSTDNGKSWERLTVQEEVDDIHAIHIDKEDNIWIGKKWDKAIYVSSDGGETWEARTAGYENYWCYEMEETEKGILFAGETRGGQVYRSLDRGITWEFSAWLRPLCFTPGYDTIMFAGTLDGLFITTDGGKTWGRNNHIGDNIIPAIAIDSSGNIYCGTAGTGTILSRDKGVTWDEIGPDSTTVLSLAFDAEGNLLAGTEQSGFFKTADTGKKWTKHSTGMYHKAVSEIRLGTNGDIYVSSTDHGIYRSTDGGETFGMIGLPVEGVSQMALYQNSYIYTATTAGLQVYDSKKETWENRGLHGVETIALAPEGVVYAGTREEGLFKSTDHGNTWELTNLTADSAMSVFNVLAINKDTLFAVTDLYLRRSFDGGNSWDVFDIKTSEVDAAIAYNEDFETLFVTGSIPPVSILYKADNLCSSFSIIKTMDNSNWLTKNCLVSKGDITMMADVSKTAFLYYSDDTGNSWDSTTVSKGMYAIYIAEEGEVFIGGKDSIFISEDYGSVFRGYKLPVPEINDVLDIETDENNHIFVGTSSDGLFELEILTGIEEQKEDKVTGYHLSQNYPNPFNPVTNIKYNIPEAGYVTVKVYDTLGREVAVPVTSYKNAGLHETRFDASGFASGVYIYKLTAGSYTAARKMLLLR